MNLNEIKKPSDKALFEALDKNNTTGLLTEDLVKIARVEEAHWHKPISGDEFDEMIRKMASGEIQ